MVFDRVEIVAAVAGASALAASHAGTSGVAKGARRTAMPGADDMAGGGRHETFNRHTDTP